MHKFNNLNDFVKSIPTDITTIIPKARYLYLELGKRSYYDTKYKYCISEEERDATYINKIYTNPNIIVCNTAINQFSDLLHIANIDNRKVCNNGHWYLDFADENKKWHTTDITNDLKNIQFRL